MHIIFEESIRLAYLLNNENCPSNIDEQYNEYYLKNKTIFDNTNKLLSTPEYECSIHDSHVENLSQKKVANSYMSSFKTVAFAYKDNIEIGYLPIEFSFITKENIRELNNKEIFSSIIDMDKKQFGVSYHHKGKLKYLIFNFEHLNISHKDVVLYQTDKKQFKI